MASKPSTVKKATPKASIATIQKGPSREAFMAAVVIKSDFDFANFGKMRPETYQHAIALARQLDDKYEELVRNA